MEIKGKTVLITGGSVGIGLAATKEFLAQWAKVIVTGRNQQKLDAAKKAYPGIVAIQSDVAVAGDSESLLAQVEKLGGIDILYNNAGVLGMSRNLGRKHSDHFKTAEYEINVNYLGVIRLNNLFMEMLQSRKESAIINTTSLLSYVPSDIAATYSASKAALRFYTESLRNHLRILGSHVKVFELLPPAVATDMTAEFEAKAISPERLAKALVAGIKEDRFTIRVGDTKIIYFLDRFFPRIARGFVNTKEQAKSLRSDLS